MKKDIVEYLKAGKPWVSHLQAEGILDDKPITLTIKRSLGGINYIVDAR